MGLFDNRDELRKKAEEDLERLDAQNNEAEQMEEAAGNMASGRPDPRNMETIMRAMTMFAASQDDPEDTLFLQLTQRDVATLGIALSVMRASTAKYPMFKEVSVAINNVARKIADAMETQKGPNSNEEE